MVEGSKTRVWSKTTPADGDLLEAELNRIYGNTNDLQSQVDAKTFLGLPDTPSSYSGQAGKIPSVNPAGNALIFVTDPLYDMPVKFAGSEFTRIAATGATSLSVPAFSAKIGSLVVDFVSSAINASNLDTGLFPNDVCSDYYIFAGLVSGSPAIRISLSKTAPVGMTSPVMIGGFHYGVVRNSVTLADVTKNQIVPRSVWTRKRGAMPSCYLLGLQGPVNFDMGGMVEFSFGKWGDIYLVSDPVGLPTGGLSTARAPLSKRGYSRYAAVPLSGTEGLNAFDFMDRAQAVGKRLLTLTEWIQIANGAPQGNNGDNLNGWASTANTQRVLTGAIASLSVPAGYTVTSLGDANYYSGRNTSLVGARDTAGNLYEWADGGASSWGSSGAWRNVMDTGESSSLLDFGQEYSGGNSVLPIMGGNWGSGVLAGSRSLYVNGNPWSVGTAIGSRFACDAL